MCHVGRRQDKLCGARSVALAGKCHVGDLEVVKIRGCLYYSVHVRTQDRWINTRCVTGCCWAVALCPQCSQGCRHLFAWETSQAWVAFPRLTLGFSWTASVLQRKRVVFLSLRIPPLGTQSITQPTPQIRALRGIAEKTSLGVDELGAKWLVHRRLARVFGLKKRMVHDEACSLVGVSSPALNRASNSGWMGLF